MKSVHYSVFRQGDKCIFEKKIALESVNLFHNLLREILSDSQGKTPSVHTEKTKVSLKPLAQVCKVSW